MQALRRSCLAFALLLAMPTAAQTVTDGDTIKLDGTTYRLGVHAHQCENPWDWRARQRGDR